MKRDSLFFLGVLMFSFWFADTIYKTFVLHAPLRTLWFSSAGLGVTTLALFTRSSFLITSMFSALTVIEGVWDVGFFSQLLFHKKISGVAEYAFASNYPKWEFFITLYHLLIIPVIIFALIKVKKIHKFGWLGATLFTSIVVFLTYFLVQSPENINCIKTIDYCQTFFRPLYRFDNPLRIFVGIFVATLFLYLPLNLILIRVGDFLRRNYFENTSTIVKPE